LQKPALGILFEKAVLVILWAKT